jgi:hypothetical protein
MTRLERLIVEGVIFGFVALAIIYSPAIIYIISN